MLFGAVAAAQDEQPAEDAQPAEQAAPAVTRQAAASDGAAFQIQRIEVTGLDAWGVSGFNPMELRVRFVRTPTGWVSEPDAPVLSLRQAFGRNLAGASLHESALQEIGLAIPGVMIEQFGVDYGNQRMPVPAIDRETGVVSYHVDPPGPGVGENSAVYSTLRIEGFSGGGLSENDILGLSVQVYGVGDGGYIAARQGLAAETMPMTAVQDPRIRLRLYDSALQAMGEAIVRLYNERGLRGIRVSGRPDGETIVLTLTEGQIGDVRTITVRESGESAINAPEQERLTNAAPVQEGDLVDIRALDEFVFRLNRRPGRRVDIALAPGPDADELTLDFLISEIKPLSLYFQLSNTGTEETEDLRERFGLTHYNITNADDAFMIDYVTGNFDKVNAVQSSYERPFESGSPYKWRVYGNWVQYDASEVGFSAQQFEGETTGFGAEFIGNVYQQGPLFIDLVAGARYEHDKVDNNLADITARNDFFLPYVGAKLERTGERQQTFGLLMLEGNLSDVADTKTGEDLDGLGRLGVTDDWWVLRYQLSHSMFLEPLLQENWGGDGSTLAHELALSVRGQLSFDDRLAPNFVQTIGGMYTVRGYPESFAFGDSAIVGTVEYRYHVPRALEPGEPITGLAGKPFRLRPQQWLSRPDWDLVLRGFLDVGATDIVDQSVGEDNATLVGAGLGLELALRRNFRAQVDFAWALREETADLEKVTSGSSQVHFLLTVLY